MAMSDDEILRRIKRDLIDGYDEELELEIEDRAGEDVLAGDAGASLEDAVAVLNIVGQAYEYASAHSGRHELDLCHRD